MKLFFPSIILILFGLSIFYLVRLESPAPSPNENCDYIRGSIIVVFKENVDREQARGVIRAFEGEVKYEYELINGFLVGVPKNQEKEYVKKFQKDPTVKSAELNKCLHLN